MIILAAIGKTKVIIGLAGHKFSHTSTCITVLLLAVDWEALQMDLWVIVPFHFGDLHMLKSILIAAALTIAASTFSPSFADEMKAPKCDDASMAMVHDAMKMSKDTVANEMADKEMKMAEMAMKDNKADDCAMHIGMAQKSLMKP